MKQGIFNRGLFSIVFAIVLLFSISLTSHVYAKPTGPGWIIGRGEPVSPEEARAFYKSKKDKIKLKKSRSLARTDSMSSVASASASSSSSSSPATVITPEIKELARALQYDPKLIYDYVHNYIDYVPNFGSLKGATLTYLDKSGNDFDQASLMIALLKESSSYNSSIATVQYGFGNMTIPSSMLANWLGVQRNIGTVFSYGGIPATAVNGGGYMIARVWVSVNIDGSIYKFDPAFKSYQYFDKIDIESATGYNRTEFITSALEGATVDNDYVQNINEANIVSKLVEYSSNFINTIRNDYPNSDIKEIIGGRNIIQSNLDEYPSSLPFSVNNEVFWDDIPSEYVTTISIQHNGIDHTFDTTEIAGKRLTITYAGSNHYPELRLEGELIASGNATTVSQRYNSTRTINHPYAADNGEYADQTSTMPLLSGATYAILTSFGGIKDDLIRKRQEKLDYYRTHDFPENSEEVLGETLNIMGITWMKEAWISMRRAADMANDLLISQHFGGNMYQEPGGYTISIDLGWLSFVNDNDGINANGLWTFLSALEHSIHEQLMGVEGVSTVKVLQIANASGHKIFYADSNNFTSVRPELYNYSETSLNNLQADAADDGFKFILPENGKITIDQWQGFGIAGIPEYSEYGAGMYIGESDYMDHGGSSSDGGSVSPDVILFNTLFGLEADFSIDMSYFLASPLNMPTSAEPVDMASGAYLYEHSDIAIGGNDFFGLSFSRFYSSGMNFRRNLGYGWTHNYDIYLSQGSHANPVFGGRLPIDATALISSFYIMLDLTSSDEDLLPTFVTMSIISKWVTDQLIDNAVTAHLGSKLMEYIKLPDGTYSPPPGITTLLIDNGDGTFSLQERFGTRIDFNIDHRIDKMTDIDSNILTFTYNGDKLGEIKDTFNRTLTLSYTGELLTFVTDSSGRSISYEYTNDDLTGYTDSDEKVWSYVYDDPEHPHRMTKLIDPMNTTLAVNTYDSLGRVDTQTFPRQGGTEIIYNFYFSGFRNIEEDQDGKQIIYYFDDKGRPVGQEDQLGNKATKEYDGQFHVIRTIDPRGNETTFEYDGNHNLIRTENALGLEIDYIYDTEFRLTNTIDPLYHGIYLEYDDEHHPISSKNGIQYDEGFQLMDNGLFEAGVTYYENGLVETATDGRGTVTSYTYDGNYGKPKTTTVGSHPAITTVYNSIGLMESLTDQVGTTTNFPEYNNRGQLKKKTDPLLKDTVMEYDNAGRLDHIIDRNGDRIDYSYTPTGKVETVTYQDLSTVIYTYNDHDDLIKMQDSLGDTVYTYYADHSLETVTDPNGFQVGYVYDEAGNLTQLTYPGNKKVIYTYDELNRLKTVTIDWLSKSTTYYYDFAGRLDWADNFNSTYTLYSYDNANRLISLYNLTTDFSVIASYNFTLDESGNRTQIIKNEPLNPVRDLFSTDYLYNPERNRLETAGTTSFVYDDQGQMDSKDSLTFGFDYEHRLVNITGTYNYDFEYDGHGNRLRAVRNGDETRYVYDAGGNLLAEADQFNIIKGYYIHGIGLLATVTPEDEIYTYHFNAIGNTIAMTDENQDIVNKYAYTSFGVLMDEDEEMPQPFKFIGQHGIMTEQNVFYYMRARYYDPEVGRFISEDPIGFDGGDVNLYAYVGNNPVLMLDPWGLSEQNSSTWGGSAFSGGTITRSHGLVTLATNGPTDSSFTRQRELTGQQWGQVAVVGLGAPAALAGGAVYAESAAGVAVINWVLSNSATTSVVMQQGADAVAGFVMPDSPPPPSPGGYVGGGARLAADMIYDHIWGR